MLSHAFRERQIYMRSEGDVRFLTLGPGRQIAGLVAIAAGIFWVAYASLGFLLNDDYLSASNPQGYRAKLEYEDRLAAMRTAVDRLNDRLLLDQGSYLDKVDEVRADYEKLVERHRLLTDLLRKGVAGETPAADDDEAPAPGKRSSLGEDSLAPTKSSKGSLNELTFRQKYAADFRSPDEAAQPLKELRGRFAEFEAAEITAVADAAKLSQERVRELKKIFSSLGFSKQRVARLASSGDADIGGPFVAASLGALATPPLTDRFQAAIQSFSQEDQLLAQVDRLPLSVPVTGSTKVSSGFGIRRDPFRRVAALHSGVDLRGQYGSKIVATAPGKVVRAGWDGAYGKSVEILHDNGISTVYAHMSAIKVKQGQQVDAGRIVGLIGSTGRSTGPHLHYETRIGGRAVDPTRFWKARNALQAFSQE
ncbi:MAG: peptidoglycan DD-metalloendopeptidase family protein [Parvibaculaceae bacterium]